MYKDFITMKVSSLQISLVKDSLKFIHSLNPEIYKFLSLIAYNFSMKEPISKMSNVLKRRELSATLLNF